MSITKGLGSKLVEFAAKNKYQANLPTPTVGDTGYMDVWDDTYRSGSVGLDMHGRLYLISRPVTFTVDDEEPVTSRLCIFQRYSAEKGGNPHVRNCNALYHCEEGKLVVETDDNQDGLLDIFVHTSERGDFYAMFRGAVVTEDQLEVILPLVAQGEIRMTRGRFGIPRLLLTSDVRECACC